MLKKLLSISLVAVLLSTVALAYGPDVTLKSAFAEAAETFTDTQIKGNATDKPVEMLWVTQTTTDDVVSQKITAVTFPGSKNLTTYTFDAGKWALVRIKVGENLTFSEMSFGVPLNIKGGTGVGLNNSYVYVAPLSYTDYNSALEIAGSATETLSTLVQPVKNGENVMEKYVKHDSNDNTTRVATFDLTPATFNNSDFYHDGYLYFAVNAANGASTARVLVIRSGDAGKWVLTISGTKVTPAVTDFSDATITWTAATGEYTVTTATASGTAMLVIASFNGTEMVDAKVATIDATTANADDVISGTITGLEEGTSYKAFLWAENTLVPAINAVEF